MYGYGFGTVFNNINTNEIVLSSEFFGTSLPDGWTLVNPNSANGLTYSTDDGAVWKSAHTSVSLISAYTDYIKSDIDFSDMNYIVISWEQTFTNKSTPISQYELILGTDNNNKIYMGNGAAANNMFFGTRISGVTDITTFNNPDTRYKMVIDWNNNTADGYYWDLTEWVLIISCDISGFGSRLTDIVWSPSDISTRTGGDFGILNSLYVTNYDYSTYTPLSGTDVWVDRFATNANISDDTIIDALDTRIKSMRYRGTFNKRFSIYPFVGGTTGADNLIALKKTSANLTGVGGITYSSNGVQGNGTTGYMYDGVIPSIKWVNNEIGISFYSRTNSSGVITDFGSLQSSAQRIQVNARNASDALLYDCYNSGATSGRLSVSNTDSSGRISVMRRVGTDVEAYRNGASLGSAAFSGGTIPSIQNFFMAANSSGTPANFSARQYAWLETFIVPLTDSEEAAEYTDELAFQTSLNRNV